MFAAAVTLNEFNRGYLTWLITDITEEQLDWQPHAGLHSMRWILAHLAIAADYGFSQLDLPFVCAAEWHQAYGPKSQAGSSESVRPSRDELLAVIADAYTRLCEAALATSPDHASLAHQVALLKRTNLKTKGDVLAHILTTHFATHLGQLSTLRRLSGKPMLF